MTETGFHLKHHLTSFQIMILGFAGVILLGALVLMLPISAAGRVWTPFHEALFTSTSAVCVTGLVVLDTGSYWSAFGQTVILLLIQIGGLGVITAAVTFLMLSGKNISLKERSAMQDAISAPVVGGIVRLTRFILKGTFLVELVGALALGPAFCRDYGLRGVWMAVFHSVSAFCNAGFDILGRTGALYPSLTAYIADPLVNIVIMLLIVIGGDRGLAGGFNANVLKLAQSRYDELSVNSEVVILPIGRKAVEYFEKRNFRIMTRYENISESISIYGAMSIADKIIDVYNKDKIDRVELFYTDCISPLVQEEKHIPIIPLDIEVDRSNVSLTNYEPSPEAVFDSLIPRYIAGVLFGAIVDSFAAEQAARRTAMENATDNANEMISNLSLVYNRARQAAITQEITEIVSGANAQE